MPRPGPQPPFRPEPGPRPGPAPEPINPEPRPEPVHVIPHPEPAPDPVNRPDPAPEPYRPHPEPGPEPYRPHPDPGPWNPEPEPWHDRPEPYPIYDPVPVPEPVPVTAGQVAYTAYGGGGSVDDKWNNAANAVRQFCNLPPITGGGNVMAVAYCTTIGNPKRDLGTFWGWGVLRESTKTAWESAAEAVKNIVAPA
jgi:hypothetical protein